MMCRLSFTSLMTLTALSLGGVMTAPAMAETKLRLAHISAPSSHFGAGAAAFAKELARLTDGRIATEIFPNSSLGGEWEVIEKLQRGEIDVTATSTGPVGNFVHDAMIFDIPFLFKGRTHAHAVLDGPIGQAILDKFPIYRLVALAWGENGFRHLTNSRRPVTSPADLKGLKLRTMENEIHIQAFSVLGAQPSPLPFNELFAALQQGVVDGQENPIPLIVSEKMAQVQQHLTLSGHTYSPALFLVSKIIFDTLSSDNKKALLIAGKAGAKAQRDRVVEIEENGIEELRKQGMKVVMKVDHTAFKAALQPAYGIYAKKFSQVKLDAIADYAP